MAEDRANGRDRPVPRTGLGTAGSSSHPSITSGPNERPVNDPIAGTAPGLPDEARAPGEELPEPPSEEEVQRIAEQLGAKDAASASRH